MNSRGCRRIPFVVFVLLLACVSIRIIAWSIYEPVVFHDTVSYIDLAREIKMLDFTEHTGERTPLYPMLLLIGGMNFKFIWLLQSLIGIGITMLLFLVAYRQTGDDILSTVIGLSYSVSVNLLFFEAHILSETLSTFLIVLSLWLYLKTDRPGRGAGSYFWTGVVVAMAGLTRPLLLFLGPLYLLFFLLTDSKTLASTRKKAKCLLSYFIPLVVIVLGWCLINQLTVGYFGPTTLTGYSLTQHSGAFVERAPSKYATIQEVYLKYRLKHQEETGTHSMTIWDAYPEILQRTGMTFSRLSRQLTRMSMELFVRYPHLYLQSVLKSWLRFWTVGQGWRLQKVKAPFSTPDSNWTYLTQRAVLVIINVETLLLLGINALFLAIACSYVLRILRGRAWLIDTFLLRIIAIVMVASLLQAFLEHGENARYSIPFQPLIAFVVLQIGWRIWHRLTKRPMAISEIY